MKRGWIVYLAGGAELPGGVDLAGRFKGHRLHCRSGGVYGLRARILCGERGLHYLFTRGYGDIRLLVAQTEQNCLRPLHPLVRLSGQERGAGRKKGLWL